MSRRHGRGKEQGAYVVSVHRLFERAGPQGDRKLNQEKHHGPSIYLTQE